MKNDVKYDVIKLNKFMLNILNNKSIRDTMSSLEMITLA